MVHRRPYLTLAVAGAIFQDIPKGSTHESLVTDRRHAKQASEEILQVVEAMRTGQRLEAVGPYTTEEEDDIL